MATLKNLAKFHNFPKMFPWHLGAQGVPKKPSGGGFYETPPPPLPAYEVTLFLLNKSYFTRFTRFTRLTRPV